MNLIIHPRDLSTDFLSPIYSSITEKTVVRNGAGFAEIIDGIKQADRVLMMGHGSPNGLFSIGNFPTGSYVIGSWCVSELVKKDNNVFIWCNADKFVSKYHLSGFYSGMFISEVSEANYCGLRDVSQEMVDHSNNQFAQILSKHINNSSKKSMYKAVRDEYGELTTENPVALYNWKRLYLA